MFTMSLGGSSVKLETGKQVGTKTRQKPLELSDKNVIFVRFKKDKIEVEIDKLNPYANISSSDELGEINNQCYLVAQVRCKGNFKYWDSNGDGTYFSRGYRGLNRKISVTGTPNPKLEHIWKPVAVQKITTDKSIYDFGLDYIKIQIFKRFAGWFKRNKKNYWTKFYSNPNHNPNDGGTWWPQKYPPFIKIRFAVVYNCGGFWKKETMDIETWNSWYNIKYNEAGFCVNDTFSTRVIRTTKEKYITL